MPEHELWLTKLFNEYLAGPANAILSAVHVEVENPQRPWTNWLVMELLVVAILLVLFAMLRTRMSVDKPGKVQHLFEIIYLFIKDTVDEIGIHHGSKFVPYFATIFIFILFMNLIGIIPTFESPTMYVGVPLGLALSSFLFYHYNGVRELGPLAYMKQFLGPIWWLFPLMIPLEIISHLARPLSLTVRLYANMFAGEQVTGAFLGLTKLLVPVIFMVLHLFVAVLQAYIFTLLSMIYVNLATSHEH
jgi:F-type H+-transporting ATPase subunit a